LAFRQATCISVISDHVRDDVVSRGIDPVKVLVNPNGVDCDEYSPPTAEQRREVRAELGLPEQRPVVGFIGTFGGWHGIDVLAEALPEICRQAPEAMFLLIGDGNLKPLVTDAIRTHNLHDRVVDVGRTKQREGARYLKAADIYVSPHSSHMRGSPFFGSPTKLFEYMALGGGIVASDLEQIGTVMSPALRPHEFRNGAPRVNDQRGVLCQPGDVQEFIEAVLGLIRCPNVSAALGKNARQAALDHFSWTKHVARTWEHVLAANLANPSRSAAMAKA
jgi:glycosyltransferase involved in cell wall biosynthesis